MKVFASAWPRQVAMWLSLLVAVAAVSGCAHDTANGNPVKPNADNKLGPMS